MKAQEFQTKIRRLKYAFSSNIFTVDNIIVGVLLLVVLSWVWGSVSAMERNYSLQKQLELKKRELKIAEIEHRTLELEQNYLKSDEYKELAARQNLGLAADGEHMIILNSYPKSNVSTASSVIKKESNFKEWMNFIFGGNAQKSTNY